MGLHSAVLPLFFEMLILHKQIKGSFLRHVTRLAIVIGHRAAPKKRVKGKLSPAFISRHGAACSVAPAMCSPYSLSFLKRDAARRGVRWGRTFSEVNSYHH